MNGRLYLNALYEILRDYTDEDHILTRDEILQKLENEKGISMKEKKFYRSIDALIEKKIPISKYTENREGYYLKRNSEQISKYLLLSHILYSSTLLSKTQSYIYVKETLEPLSIYQRKLFTNIVYHPLQKRCNSPNWLPCIHTLHRAIFDCHTVKFNYMHYSESKKLDIETGPFLVDPYLIAYNESYTYLIGWNHEHADYSHYRIDRIGNITITDQIYKSPKELHEAYDYAQSKLSMFTGETVPVKLHCLAKRNVLDHIIDELGPNVHINTLEDGTYEIRTRATVQGIKIFSQKYIDAVRIIEPTEAREDLKNTAQKLIEYYATSKVL